MTDYNLESLPYSVYQTNRVKKNPAWANRYRPAFVSRTAAEIRRKALIDYLALSSGTRINDKNFPTAVKEERKLRQSQLKRSPAVFREATDPEMLKQTHSWNSPSPIPNHSVTPSSVFITHFSPIHRDQHYLDFAIRGVSKLGFGSQCSSPRINATHSSSAGLSLTRSPTQTPRNTVATAPLRNSTNSQTPNQEPYFSQWRKEFWHSEASKRGKIMYFQINQTAQMSSKNIGRSASSTPSPTTRPLSTPTPSDSVNTTNILELLNKQDDMKVTRKVSKAAKSDPHNKTGPEQFEQTETVYNTSDGSFPLSYVEIRPVEEGEQAKGATNQTPEEVGPEAETDEPQVGELEEAGNDEQNNTFEKPGEIGSILEESENVTDEEDFVPKVESHHNFQTPLLIVTAAEEESEGNQQQDDEDSEGSLQHESENPLQQEVEDYDDNLKQDATASESRSDFNDEQPVVQDRVDESSEKTDDANGHEENTEITEDN